MEYRVCDSVLLPAQETKTDLDSDLNAKLSDPTVKDFFTTMAICNTVIVSSSKKQIGNGTITHTELENASPTDESTVMNLKYEAESPDEAALVQVCIACRMITTNII